MKNTQSPSLNAAAVLAGSLLFAGACYQWPLFSSNQNTYFLSGLARAGYGYLSSDWLANQTDHIPVFSWIVSGVQSLNAHWIFYVIFFFLAAVYAVSLFIVAVQALSRQWSVLHTTVLLALLTLLHCAWILPAAARYIPGLWRIDSLFVWLASLATNGVAGQYILGPFLQPSAFGVLLIASIAFFLHKRELVAVFCAVLAATIHPTYVLHAGILTAAYMFVLVVERRTGRAVSLGALAALLILPTILYVVIVLHPTNQTVLAEAQSVLVDLRIPHHAKVSSWFGKSTLVQLSVMFIGVIASYRCRRLFIVLAVSLSVSIGLSCLQVLSGNPGIALLFPWRLSTWLVPISSAILLAWSTAGIVKLMDCVIPSAWLPRVKQITIYLCATFMVGICVAGIWKTVSAASTQSNDVAYFAKRHATSGQAYLVPLKKETFRLNTGIPVFVDWKSHPYRDNEVLQWYNRVEMAKAFYQAANPKDASAALASILKVTRITHVIVEREHEYLLAALHCKPIFRDTHYIVAELIGDGRVEQSNALDGE